MFNAVTLQQKRKMKKKCVFYYNVYRQRILRKTKKKNIYISMKSFYFPYILLYRL